MTNREIANAFRELGKLMELHDENKFKIRSYSNAYRTIRALESPLSDMEDEAIQSIKGVGKAIAGKIRELLDKGSMNTLERYRSETPVGVREMLQLKGFGAKKIRLLWKNLGAETLGEVLYACHENRLVSIKGFGAKTQADLKASIEYFISNKGKFHYAKLQAIAEETINALRTELNEARIEFCGDYRRKSIVLEQVDMLIAADAKALLNVLKTLDFQIESEDSTLIIARKDEIFPFHFYLTENERFGTDWVLLTGSDAYLAKAKEALKETKVSDEKEAFAKAGIAYRIPELREELWIEKEPEGKLLEKSDLKGVIHNHSTYSDGSNTLEQMAEGAKERGYEYLVISDHSQTAVYASGLKPEGVKRQWAEIDELNEKLAPFKIFKGIESDILADGSLDYDEELLAGFDVVIASVHSGLKMDEQKATDRLLRAIRSPYTKILGHPTGRLLLAREGYPIDHRAIIDACAEEGVSIELNANPHRLDIDWTWIPYAMEKGVLIGINPDAHSVQGYDDVEYGVYAARKGGLTVKNCLSAKSLEEFEQWLNKKP